MATRKKYPYNPTNDPKLKGPDVRYITAGVDAGDDSTGTHLGPVSFADDRLGSFISDYLKGDKSTTIHLEDFLKAKDVKETMLDSILNKVSNTVIGTYGRSGTRQYTEEDELVELRGQFKPFRPDLNPGVSPRDTAFVSNTLASKPRTLMKTLMHELFGHQLAIQHDEEDYEADRPIYEKLEKGTTEGMTAGTQSQIMQLLFPHGFKDI